MAIFLTTPPSHGRCSFMTDLKTAHEMMAAAVAAKGTEDPEIASVKRVLTLLDKTAKSNRTYGSTNPVAQKFSQQLFQELTGHLTTYSKLTVLIQRSALLFRESVVSETDKDSGCAASSISRRGWLRPPSNTR